MHPFVFCNRCRGLQVGWNKKYAVHCLICQQWLSSSFRIIILTGLLSSFVLFPISTGLIANDPRSPHVGVSPTIEEARVAKRDASTRAALEQMLSRFHLPNDRQARVVRAIMASSTKYRVDPRLIASIVIVESGANPFAVSSAESVGIMQIHVRTWGSIAESQNINLFKIEDNIDFGVRILRDYIASSNTWEGVARYLGKTASPESQQAALEYVQKVQRIYGWSPQNVSMD